MAACTDSGSSRRSFSLALGKMTRRMPARCAASTFSLIPPTGKTRPVRVISPVMAVWLRMGRPVYSDVTAVAIVTPADGPSLGTAPAGTWICSPASRNLFGLTPSFAACAQT